MSSVINTAIFAFTSLDAMAMLNAPILPLAKLPATCRSAYAVNCRIWSLLSGLSLRLPASTRLPTNVCARNLIVSPALPLTSITPTGVRIVTPIIAIQRASARSAALLLYSRKAVAIGAATWTSKLATESGSSFPSVSCFAARAFAFAALRRSAVVFSLR